MSDKYPRTQRSIDHDGIPLAGEGFVLASELPAESILSLDANARSHYKAVLKQLRMLAQATPNEQREAAIEAVIDDVEALFPECESDQLDLEPVKHVEREQVQGTTVVVQSWVYDDGDADRENRERLAEETSRRGIEESRVKWDGGDGDGDE